MSDRPPAAGARDAADSPEPTAAPPADPWADLRRHTPARIALGRAGTSLPTAELLRFAAAHAQARDAVQVPLDVAALTLALDEQGWPVLVARPFNHIGPGQMDSFVVASAARQICRIKQGLQPAQLQVGDIDVTRDFLDVADVVSAYLALLAKGEPGQVYNICSGVEQSVRGLIEQLADLAQVQVQLIQDPARMRRAEQRRVCGSHARLHQTTGWAPELTTQQSLRAILSDWESRVRQE